MIVRCHHLREAGIMNGDCCSHCHIYGSYGRFRLSHGHEAHLCCARADSFTPEEVAVIIARIPEWEKQEDYSSALLATPEIPLAFRPAYQAIQRLEGDEHYRAALIFGSIALGDANEYSEMEVLMIVSDGASSHRPHKSYLMLEGARLSLIFYSFDQFHDKIYQAIERQNRVHPVFIARSLIVFDKTSKLHRMQEGARQGQPRSVSLHEKQQLQAIGFDCRASIKRTLEEDPFAGSHIMYDGLQAFLVCHYRLHRRWWVGSSRVFSDLRHWDRELARLVEQFLVASNLDEKFQRWLVVSDYVLHPLEDCSLVSNALCSCDKCRANLAPLLEK